eukprot:1764265-Rhodomonas_salina.1
MRPEEGTRMRSSFFSARIITGRGGSSARWAEAVDPAAEVCGLGFSARHSKACQSKGQNMAEQGQAEREPNESRGSAEAGEADQAAGAFHGVGAVAGGEACGTARRCVSIARRCVSIARRC